MCMKTCRLWYLCEFAIEFMDYSSALKLMRIVAQQE
jgi:hypothetical protein